MESLTWVILILTRAGREMIISGYAAGIGTSVAGVMIRTGYWRDRPKSGDAKHVKLDEIWLDADTARMSG